MKTSIRYSAIGLAISSILLMAHAESREVMQANSDRNIHRTAQHSSINSSANSMRNSKDLRSFSMSSAQNMLAMDCGPSSQKHFINNQGSKAESIKVRVTGYGAPPKTFFPDAQRRLMAMRAAKIDAYRSLAERVTGVQIWGGTTIGDMVVEKDRFRVYIDTYISGARVIAENPLDDGTFETIVELNIDQFFLNNTLPNEAKSDCINGSETGTNAKVNMNSGSSQAALSRTNFYFSDE